MLLGVCAAALLSAAGILLRRVWSAYGFALILILAMLALILFALTGQSSAGFLQILVGLLLYTIVAGLFVLAGLSLGAAGAKRGTPIPWILIALIFSVPFILYRPVSIDNNAMENTLLAGDFILVDRFSGTHPAHSDLVAFHNPKDRQQISVMRVKGLPGDRIADGSIVPPDHYYVLGDNLDHSIDSRTWGFLNAGDIIGQPKFIYDSLAPDPADLKPTTPTSSQLSITDPTHPPLRRWERIFKTI
jgi:signal peptidase I